MLLGRLEVGGGVSASEGGGGPASKHLFQPGWNTLAVLMKSPGGGMEANPHARGVQGPPPPHPQASFKPEHPEALLASDSLMPVTRPARSPGSARGQCQRGQRAVDGECPSKEGPFPPTPRPAPRRGGSAGAINMLLKVGFTTVCQP